MRRALNLFGFLACAGMLGFAWYAQSVLGLEPCPLCIFQRIGVALIGVLFLLAALQNPRRWGASIYGVLQLLACLATLGVAARHLWVQAQPPGAVPSCGASPGYMLLQLHIPVGQVIRRVLTGSGECAVVNWKLLGLSMPAWVLIACVALGGLALVANFKAASPRDRRT